MWVSMNSKYYVFKILELTKPFNTIMWAMGYLKAHYALSGFFVKQ